MPATRPLLVFAAAAVFLLLPSLILGTLISHSSPQNLTWAAQFADQFRAGILYPRSLPDSFDGLSGPGFYFYPPIAFWLDALLSAASFNALLVSYRLSLASLLLLWASGVAMHVWLKAEAVSSRLAVYGALAYMAAPYHLVDHYYRGAYAEFAAYAVLPLVMTTVRWVAAGRRGAALWLAVSYAALPMTHLPTALLISLTALPLYVLYRGWRFGAAKPALDFFARCLLGGVLGLGLAAIYLVPALTLQDWIPAEGFWAGDFRLENSFLLTMAREHGFVEMMVVVAWSSAAYGVAAIGTLVVLLWNRSTPFWQPEAAFWAIVCTLCLLLVAGLLPWFWQIPFVAKVQFPWRLMIVVEFAAITALCLLPWPLRPRAMQYVMIATIALLVPTIGELGSGIRYRIQVSLNESDLPQDLNQFLPARFPQKVGAGYADLSLEPLVGVPTIACSPQPLTCRATSEPFGALRLEIESNQPTSVVLRRFHFPFWQLDPPLTLAGTEPLHLISFTAPAGRQTYRLQRVAVREEKAGWVISGLSLALLLAWTISARNSARRENR